MPRDPKPKERYPYTRKEIINIFAAADSFGKYPHGRLRARALLSNYSKLGIQFRGSHIGFFNLVRACFPPNVRVQM